MSHTVPAPGGPLTPLALRELAKWLDVADRAFVVLAEQQGQTYKSGHAVQVDLNRWADELEQGRLITALTGPTETEETS